MELWAVNRFMQTLIFESLKLTNTCYVCQRDLNLC